MDKEPVHFNQVGRTHETCRESMLGEGGGRLLTELLAEAWLQSIVGVWGTLGMSPEKGL